MAMKTQLCLSLSLSLSLFSPSPQPENTRLCDGVEEDVLKNRVKDMEKLGVAGFMTEWYVGWLMWRRGVGEGR